MAVYAIETIGLSVYYGQHRGVLDVDLHVEQGEVFGFLGPNGAGKTTTQRVLMDIIRPTAGEARILGLDLGTLRPGARANIAVVDPDLTWKVDSEKFESKSRNSPFVGRELQGGIWLTIVDGMVVYEEGSVVD